MDKQDRPPGRLEVHRCGAVSCPTSVPTDRLMCRRHWYMVPPKVRSEVIAHHRAEHNGDDRPSLDWMIAAQLAIIAVAYREGRQIAALKVRLDTLIGRGDRKWAGYLERTVREMREAVADGVIPEPGSGFQFYGSGATDLSSILGPGYAPPAGDDE